METIGNLIRKKINEDIARKISEILIEANQEKPKEESEENQNIH